MRRFTAFAKSIPPFFQKQKKFGSSLPNKFSQQRGRPKTQTCSNLPKMKNLSYSSTSYLRFPSIVIIKIFSIFTFMFMDYQWQIKKLSAISLGLFLACWKHSYYLKWNPRILCVIEIISQIVQCSSNFFTITPDSVRRTFV